MASSTSAHVVSIPVSTELEQQLPADPAEQQRVLELGLREWRILDALQAFRRGEGSLAKAAERAGISLREMIPLAYAHGLTPRVDPDWLDGPLSIEQASRL